MYTDLADHAIQIIDDRKKINIFGCACVYEYGMTSPTPGEFGYKFYC